MQSQGCRYDRSVDDPFVGIYQATVIYCTLVARTHPKIQGRRANTQMWNQVQLLLEHLDGFRQDVTRHGGINYHKKAHYWEIECAEKRENNRAKLLASSFDFQLETSKQNSVVVKRAASKVFIQSSRRLHREQVVECL